MDTAKKSSGRSGAQFWFVFALFILLMALAHGGAELQAQLDAHAALGLPVHNVLYYRVIFTIWVSIILLTPALCFHVFSRASAANSYWRAFWTFSYLAFLTHIYWTVFVMFHLNWAEIFHSQAGIAVDPQRVVEHPGPNLFLAAWWGLDVSLAWLVPDLKWVRVQRGAVPLLAFIMFFGEFTLSSSAGMLAHVLGIVMLMAVAGCFLLSSIIRESDPKSLVSVLYIKAFQFLNLFVVWHKLPTFLGVANLSALRDVLREKNLHSTSDIAVTNPSGLRSTVPFQSAFLTAREEDGQYNDLSKPTMGNASVNTADPFNNSEFTLSNPGARFGRNIPRSEVDPTRDAGILEPSPRLVSNRLLARQVTSDGTDDFK